MKQQIRKTAIVLTGLFMFSTGIVSAQNSNTIKPDKIVFLNGNAKEGKVIAFANDKIQFVHRGETLNYEFNKKEIEKIEYASGFLIFRYSNRPSFIGPGSSMFTYRPSVR